MTDFSLERLVTVLAGVTGIDAIVLGGSRSRGDALPSSDYDIGLYFPSDRPLHVEDLTAAMAQIVDLHTQAKITSIGEWGPWIVGGGWLTIGGQTVDLLFRQTDLVNTTIDRALEGNVSIDYQPGHPHGFISTIWLAEVHHCIALHDPDGTLAGLKRRLVPYPDALALAIADRFQWEISFAIGCGTKGLARKDWSYLAGSIFRALACTAQVICAINGTYLMNEKGALAIASRLPQTVPNLEGRIDSIWNNFGRREYAAALELLVEIDRDLGQLTVAWRADR